MEPKTEPRKRTKTTVTFDIADVQRAEAAVALLQKRPEYKHLRLKPTDVIRMAVGVGLDTLTK